MTFVHEIDNGWWELDKEKGRVYNRYGAGHDYCEECVIGTLEAGSWEEMVRKTVRDDSCSTGWLSPNGEFYGCSPESHSGLAEYYIGKNSLALEKEGWIKIYELPDRLVTEMIMDGKIPYAYGALTHFRPETTAQEDKLIDMGFVRVKGEWRMLI